MSHSSSSTFATVLRRSNFASYDPYVAQIYTTYGGHAHRGDWGLKRPLALTKIKTSYRYIPAVDSKEQQTVWHNAEHPAKWIKTFDELGVDPWTHQHNLHPALAVSNNDSDFSPKDPDAVPEPQVLARAEERLGHNPKRMRRFIEHMRRERHKYAAYVARRVGEIPANHAFGDRGSSSSTLKLLEPKDPAQERRALEVLRQSQKPEELYYWSEPDFSEAYLKWKDAHVYSAKGSTRLLPESHPTLGLSYTSGVSLTNKFLYKPLPARIFRISPRELNRRSDPLDTRTHVGIGGVVASLHREDYRPSTPSSDGSEHQGKTVMVKVTSASLLSKPDVLGQTDGRAFDLVRLETVASLASTMSTAMTNGYVPGSRLYVAHADRSKAVRFDRTPQKPRAEPQKPAQSKEQMMASIETLYHK